MKMRKKNLDKLLFYGSSVSGDVLFEFYQQTKDKKIKMDEIRKILNNKSPIKNNIELREKFTSYFFRTEMWVFAAYYFFFVNGEIIGDYKEIDKREKNIFEKMIGYIFYNVFDFAAKIAKEKGIKKVLCSNGRMENFDYFDPEITKILKIVLGLPKNLSLKDTTYLLHFIHDTIASHVNSNSFYSKDFKICLDRKTFGIVLEIL
jgi:hypothetical protein